MSNILNIVSEEVFAEKMDDLIEAVSEGGGGGGGGTEAIAQHNADVNAHPDKISKVTGATADNIAKFTADGGIADAGIATSDLATKEYVDSKTGVRSVIREIDTSITSSYEMWDEETEESIEGYGEYPITLGHSASPVLVTKLGFTQTADPYFSLSGLSVDSVGLNDSWMFDKFETIGTYVNSRIGQHKAVNIGGQSCYIDFETSEFVTKVKMINYWQPEFGDVTEEDFEDYEISYTFDLPDDYESGGVVLGSYYLSTSVNKETKKVTITLPMYVLPFIEEYFKFYYVASQRRTMDISSILNGFSPLVNAPAGTDIAVSSYSAGYPSEYPVTRYLYIQIRYVKEIT